MFLGVTPEVSNWSNNNNNNNNNNSFSLLLTDNPLVDFVELPPEFSELRLFLL